MFHLGQFLSLIATVSAVFSQPLLPSPFPSPSNSLPPVIQHGPANVKEIALTFDADMTPGMLAAYQKKKVSSWYNKAVTDTLEETNTKATLFLTGMWAELYPKDAKKLAENSLFEIGNHSYSHPSMGGICFGLSNIPISSYKMQITKAEKSIEKITGVKPKYFRFPGGCMNEFSLAAVSESNLIPIGWDVVSDDSFNFNTKSIEENVLSHVHNGAIIVMHMHGGPNAPMTADALRFLIPALKKEGYMFVTISNLLPKLSIRYTERR